MIIADINSTNIRFIIVKKIKSWNAFFSDEIFLKLHVYFDFMSERRLMLL